MLVPLRCRQPSGRARLEVDGQQGGGGQRVEAVQLLMEQLHQLAPLQSGKGRKRQGRGVGVGRSREAARAGQGRRQAQGGPAHGHTAAAPGRPETTRCARRVRAAAARCRSSPPRPSPPHPCLIEQLLVGRALRASLECQQGGGALQLGQVLRQRRVGGARSTRRPFSGAHGWRNLQPRLDQCTGRSQPVVGAEDAAYGPAPGSLPCHVSPHLGCPGRQVAPCVCNCL